MELISLGTSGQCLARRNLPIGKREKYAASSFLTGAEGIESNKDIIISMPQCGIIVKPFFRQI